ncbi:unnamed protein product [Coregonus sp. 'balchen']|nr:unnamed protein product [Coregonus sp. 'balchen']
MSEFILTFQYQLNGVMETILKTAVHEITRLVKDNFLEEVTGSKQEVDVLKERLQRWRDREEERKRREVEEKEQRKKREEREQRGMCGPNTLPEREGPQETATPSSSCVSERMEEMEAHVVSIKEEHDDWGDLVTQMITSTNSPIMSQSRLQRLSSHHGASELLPPAPRARKEHHLLPRRKIPDSLGTGVIWRRLNPSLSIIVNQTGKRGAAHP